MKALICIIDSRKQQFAYCTMFEDNVKLKGLAKFNLWKEPQLEGKEKIEVGGNVEGVILFGPGRYGSEAVFIPRSEDASNDEDDGYLICFVHDETTGYGTVLLKNEWTYFYVLF